MNVKNMLINPNDENKNYKKRKIFLLFFVLSKKGKNNTKNNRFVTKMLSLHVVLWKDSELLLETSCKI